MTTKNACAIMCCLAVSAFAGCESDSGEGTPAPDSRPLLFTAGIGQSGSADTGARTARAEGGNGAQADLETDMTGARDLLLKKTFNWSEEPRDIIRICNVESNADAPDFELTNRRTYQYVCSKYIGTYEDNGSDDEDDHVTGNHTSYSEYEFQPDNSKGFYISNLADDGSNYFRFYAAWWRGWSHGNAPAKIAEDQSKEEDFRNSDLLLATMGHNIDEFDKPFRLIFYHSFCMLDIRVTVPVYSPGNKEGEEESLPSGYRKDEVTMSMTNVPVKYTIASTTDVSGGTPVEVFPAEDAPVIPEIPMHRYYTEDENLDDNSPDAGHDEEDEKGAADKTSKYRTYGFCGIILPMKWDNTNTSRPLLRLHLKDPITGNDETYIYTPKLESETGSQEFALAQGQISVLHLKLYRAMKKMLVVGAEIEPWEKATGNVDMIEDPAG